MEDLINTVTQKTGVSADTVRKVLQSAADFIKQKLPPQFASQVDSYLSGGGGAGGNAGQGGGLAGMVGGLFGGGGSGKS